MIKAGHLVLSLAVVLTPVGCKEYIDRMGGGEAADDDDAVGDDDTQSDDDTTAELHELAGACSLADRIGMFQVQHETAYSATWGEVMNGVVPKTILENILEIDECRLLKKNDPVCNPPCGAGFTCDFDGECVPFPEARSVGKVTIDGLNKDVEMEYPKYWDTQLPHPAFEPGADIVLVASGADYSGFTLRGGGVTPLEFADETWIVREGEPLVVTWVPANNGLALIHLEVQIHEDLQEPVVLVCDLPDTGYHSVPVELIDGLIDHGVSPWKTGHLYRRTVDSVDVEEGCVEFVVYSHRFRQVAVAGHTYCDEQADCPDGLECDLETNTCV